MFMYIPFIKYRKIFYCLSGLLVIASFAAMIFFGLRFGIDFKGGSSLQVEYSQKRPPLEDIRESLKEVGLSGFSVQLSGEKGVILKAKELDEEMHQKVLAGLEKLGDVKSGSESFQSIGPVVGRELKEKTKKVVFLALFAILIYIALSFRRVSRPIKSYIYGIAGLIALCHDVFIPLGVLALLGKFYGAEINIPIITAFLTVFGYSINDSVVVFDRIRENLLKSGHLPFEEVVEKSLNQSLIRSVNTSFTTLLVLLAIFFFGGQTLKLFSFSLALGILLGTYSSICLAAPFLVSFLKARNKKA